MSTGVMGQAARWIAVILVGAGVAGAAGAIGLREYAIAAGAILTVGGGLFVAVTISAWNTSAYRSRVGSAAFDGYDLLTPGVFRAINLAFLGIGLLAGSLASVIPRVLVVGVAGLAGLALLFRERER